MKKDDKVKPVKKGQQYATLVIRLPLYSRVNTTDDYLEHEILEYLGDQVAHIAEYAASRTGVLEDLEIRDSPVKWYVE